MTRPSLKALDHLVLTVADMDRSLTFYTDVLGMIAVSFRAADDRERHALRFGDQKINLHPAEAPFAPHAKVPMQGSADLCFLTDTPLEVWQTHLDRAGVTPEAGPVPRTGATGPILSIYLRDPDGNLLEIATRA